MSKTIQFSISTQFSSIWPIAGATNPGQSGTASDGNEVVPRIPQSSKGGCPCGVMVKAMDCGIVVSEFVFQSRYYVHFRANTLGKGMNPLILPAMG